MWIIQIWWLERTANLLLYATNYVRTSYEKSKTKYRACNCNRMRRRMMSIIQHPGLTWIAFDWFWQSVYNNKIIADRIRTYFPSNSSVNYKLFSTFDEIPNICFSRPPFWNFENSCRDPMEFRQFQHSNAISKIPNTIHKLYFLLIDETEWLQNDIQWNR